MVSKTLDLPWQFGNSTLPSDEYINVRIISNVKWDYKAKFRRENYVKADADIIHFDSIVMFFHGGGFISGSSSFSRKQTYSWAMNTGFPIFSVDYRLSPQNKFPIALTDAWLSYLWLVYYSEKYLNIRFDKILILGDSAGANLSIGIVNLAIQKDWRLPDGLILLYPTLITSFVHISPSIMLSIDDYILNIMFIELVLTSYTDPHSGLSNHHLLSPFYTPTENLK